jgi:proteasome alpha subunit
MEYFEKNYREDLTMEEAVDMGVKALSKGTEGKLNPEATEIGVVDKDFKFHILSPSETNEYVMKAVGGK